MNMNAKLYRLRELSKVLKDDIDRDDEKILPKGIREFVEYLLETFDEIALAAEAGSRVKTYTCDTIISNEFDGQMFERLAEDAERANIGKLLHAVREHVVIKRQPDSYLGKPVTIVQTHIAVVSGK